MNNNNNDYEVIRGRQYRYDPDFDAYYPVPAPEGAVSRWAWVFVTLLLAAIAYYIEFHAK